MKTIATAFTVALLAFACGVQPVIAQTTDNPPAADAPVAKAKTATQPSHKAVHRAKPVAASSTTTAKPESKPAVKTIAKRSRRAPVLAAAAIPATMGEQEGLSADGGSPFELRSNVALVVDQDTNEVLLSKNPQAVLPIASITKLMTGLLIAEAGQPMDEKITITEDDRDTYKGTGSRLAFGTTLTRGELLHLALMSSENRAAHALARSYPGGIEAFIPAMNHKAAELGMHETHYVEPTGLSPQNESSARDLAALVKVAHEVPLLRELTTSKEYSVRLGRREVAFHSTNGLVRGGTWDIGLQKTGFINEAGKCLVMQAQLAGRNLIMVFLDIPRKYPRLADPERIKKWLLSNPPAATAVGDHTS